MEDKIDSRINREIIGHILLNELEVLTRLQAGNILEGSCDEIVYADNPMAFVQEVLTQV